MDATLLVVDDLPENLTVLGELLSDDYVVRAATHGERALELARLAPPPDLILLDVVMPGMDGTEVLARLRADPATRAIPVMFVTARDRPGDEERGLALGAVDYVTKPFLPEVVRARVRTQIELKRARDRLADHNAALEAEVERRLGENLAIQDAGILALARLAETRDPDTGHHLQRTREYVRTLAAALAAHPRFRGTLAPQDVDLLAKSAPLHDIGKVGIPDHVLLKPGRLTDAEWEVMKTHARLGAAAIERAEQDAERPIAFLSVAKDIAHHHHERWDGGGYPDGLGGDAIPLPARLMALADVFDALISRRVYKGPIACDDARARILAERGRHFDPDVVDAFDRSFARFVEIATRFADPDPAAAAGPAGAAAAGGRREGVAEPARVR